MLWAQVDLAQPLIHTYPLVRMLLYALEILSVMNQKE